MINGQNQTDETECDHWECDNKYTHCDRIWNCPNGKDEIYCPSNSPSNCSLNEHLCVSPKTNQFICLPIEKTNDGQIDCLGAYDEPQICRMKSSNYKTTNNFHCRNQTNSLCIGAEGLCDNHNDCEHEDDEQFCTTNRGSMLDTESICFPRTVQVASDVEKFLCQRSSI